MIEPLIKISIIYILFAVIVLLVFKLVNRLIKLHWLVLIIGLLSPLLLYLPTEIRTFKYGSQFSTFTINTGFNLPVVYYRVFSINDKNAKLFIVEGKGGKHQVGNFYWFSKEEGQWQFNGKWETVWSSNGGSASKFTVPPYF